MEQNPQALSGLEKIFHLTDHSETHILSKEGQWIAPDALADPGFSQDSKGSDRGHSPFTHPLGFQPVVLEKAVILKKREEQAKNTGE